MIRTESFDKEEKVESERTGGASPASPARLLFSLFVAGVVLAIKEGKSIGGEEELRGGGGGGCCEEAWLAPPPLLVSRFAGFPSTFLSRRLSFHTQHQEP